MRSNRAVMFVFVCFILSKLFWRCQLRTEWQMRCCGCSPSIALCDAGDARTGSSAAPHHLPPAPSREKSCPSHPAPGASTKPVPSPAQPLWNAVAQRDWKRPSCWALWPCQGGICHRAGAPWSGSDALGRVALPGRSQLAGAPT